MIAHRTFGVYGNTHACSDLPKDPPVDRHVTSALPANVDLRFDRHARPQAIGLILVGIECDTHGNALYYFHVIAGGESGLWIAACFHSDRGSPEL